MDTEFVEWSAARLPISALGNQRNGPWQVCRVSGGGRVDNSKPACTRNLQRQTVMTAGAAIGPRIAGTLGLCFAEFFRVVTSHVRPHLQIPAYLRVASGIQAALRGVDFIRAVHSVFFCSRLCLRNCFRLNRFLSSRQSAQNHLFVDFSTKLILHFQQ